MGVFGIYLQVGTVTTYVNLVDGDWFCSQRERAIEDGNNGMLSFAKRLPYIKVCNFNEQDSF